MHESQKSRIGVNTIQQEIQTALEYHRGGQFHRAKSIYLHILDREPNNPNVLHLLGVLNHQSGDNHLAVNLITQAIRINPRVAIFYNNLGEVFRAMNVIDKAIACYEMAIKLEANNLEGYSNLGRALMEKGRIDEAISACQTAIDFKPDFADGHWNKALLLLLKGNFAEGWAEFEWRWRCKNPPLPRKNFSQPLWKGSDPTGRALLLYAEQGFGDTIQFVRYAPLAAKRGARVIVECQPELKSLLQGVEGVEVLLAAGEPLPPFDLQAPLLSLPLAFNTTIHNIPDHAPYISTNPSLVEAWRTKLACDHCFKVGLVWAGKTMRSLSLSAFAPLGAMRGVRFYSLQKGKEAEEVKNPPPGMDLVDVSKDIKDFSDTAALIANLDLVISIDTAVVHLAGALAKPVWTLLPFAPDWRWMLGREDSPWYPTMRLFRQQATRDWVIVIRRVAEELQRLSGKKKFAE